MKPYSRSDRVAGLIQHLLADMLQKEIRDPRLDQTTITTVKVTRDLRIARIYFVTKGAKGAAQAALDGFARAKGFVKRELARKLGLRYMPDLEFFYDDSIDHGARIDRLLKMVNQNDQAHH